MFHFCKKRGLKKKIALTCEIFFSGVTVQGDDEWIGERQFDADISRINSLHLIKLGVRSTSRKELLNCLVAACDWQANIIPVG
jgi:hypothetical protein